MTALFAHASAIRHYNSMGVQFGTGQGAVMPCGWEGNRGSGVALAMRRRLQRFIYIYGLTTYEEKKDDHCACTEQVVLSRVNTRKISVPQLGRGWPPLPSPSLGTPLTAVAVLRMTSCHAVIQIASGLQVPAFVCLSVRLSRGWLVMGVSGQNYDRQLCRPCRCCCY